MEKTCPICNTIFYVKPSHFEKRICCSKKCQNINQKNKIGLLNNNYKGGIKDLICKNCNKTFQSGYNKRSFCCHKCSTDYLKGKERKLHENTLKYIELKKIIGLNNPNKKCKCGFKKDIKAKTCYKCFHESIKRIKKCVICDMSFSPANIVVKTCSKRCLELLNKKNSFGENNPNWKGGLMTENKKQRQSHQYISWRKNVFERDKYKCQKCGCIGGNLHAHHIKPFAKYIELRFDLDNGLTLCFDCHKKVHKNMNFKLKNYENQTQNAKVQSKIETS